jgi:hypothetical protein
MASDIEIAKSERRDLWLRSLPQEVRLNTDLTQQLCAALADNSPAKIASLLATCIRSRAWEAIAEFSDRDPKVEAYGPLQWCRQCLHKEPDELMCLVASPLPEPEIGAGAAIELIHLVKQYEPTTFRLLLDPDDPRNWRALLKSNEKREGGPWVEAAAELDRETKRDEGRPKKNDGGPPRFPDVTRAESGTRDNIRRRLEKYADNAEACKEKGTTTKRVKQALRNFLAGHPAQACVRDAGLASPNQDKGARIRINGPAYEVARRIIDHLGSTNAAAVAASITHLLAND